MGNHALRVCPESLDGAPAAPAAKVKLRLRDVFPLLLHAHRHNYTWLRDLADDEILVTTDVADILRSFDRIMQEKKRA